MFGGSFMQRVDISDSYDPRVVGRAAPKGTLFRYVPSVGQPVLLIKSGSGDTAWIDASGTTLPNPKYVYTVAANGTPYATIQSALNAAEADGCGVGGVHGTVLVAPGTYTENLVLKSGVSIVALSSPVNINSVRLVGQHSYVMHPTGDPLEPAIYLSGLDLIDNNPSGDTILVTGTPADSGFFQVMNCNFSKSGASGRCIHYNAPNLIGVVAQCAIIYGGSSDPVIEAQGYVLSVALTSHSSNSTMPFLRFSGVGTVNFFNNQALTNAPFICEIQSGNVYDFGNFLGSFQADADGIRVAAGVTYYCTHSTLIVPVGTGYAWQGSGTLNGTLIAYGISNAKDPSLTFNLLPSDS